MTTLKFVESGHVPNSSAMNCNTIYVVGNVSTRWVTLTVTDKLTRDTYTISDNDEAVRILEAYLLELTEVPPSFITVEVLPKRKKRRPNSFYFVKPPSLNSTTMLIVTSQNGQRYRLRQFV